MTTYAIQLLMTSLIVLSIFFTRFFFVLYLTLHVLRYGVINDANSFVIALWIFDA